MRLSKPIRISIDDVILGLFPENKYLMLAKDRDTYHRIKLRDIWLSRCYTGPTLDTCSYVSQNCCCRNDVDGGSYAAFENIPRRWMVIEADQGILQEQFWIHQQLARRYGNLGCLCWSGERVFMDGILSKVGPRSNASICLRRLFAWALTTPIIGLCSNCAAFPRDSIGRLAQGKMSLCGASDDRINLKLTRVNLHCRRRPAGGREANRKQKHNGRRNRYQRKRTTNCAVHIMQTNLNHDTTAYAKHRRKF